MLKSKIHRATVTQANVDYVGSVTIDEALLAAANILPNELVQVVDITNGARLETYAIPGKKGSGVVGINGAAAQLVGIRDLVIIMSYMQVPERRLKPTRLKKSKAWKPSVVHVNEWNQQVRLGNDPSEPSSNDSIRPPHALH